MTHLDKQKLIKKYRDWVFKTTGIIPKYFVETGTYKGEMVKAQMKIFDVVISIEADEKLFQESWDKFKNCKNVFIYHGNSANEILYFVTLSDWIVYWLDAHYCGGETADIGLPLMSELTFIKNANKHAVILIDDYDCFYGHLDAIKLMFSDVKIEDNVICITT
jgi:hypothetical protein